MVGILNTEGATKAIFSMLEMLPMGTAVIAVFTVLCIIFTATTFDSISYILASVVQNNVTEEPMRWNRMFWAFTLSFLPTVLMFMGGLSTLQTAAIVGGLPLLGISVMLMISAVRATSLDLRHQDDYVESTINIEELPDVDPWSTEGMALARFEKARDAAQEAAEAERLAMNELAHVRKQIRAFALEHSLDENYADHNLPQELQDALQHALDNIAKAKEYKQQASELSQQARMDFDNVIPNPS